VIVGGLGDIYDLVVKVLGNIVLVGGAVSVVVVCGRWLWRGLVVPASLELALQSGP
jgi:hypothetical protein